MLFVIQLFLFFKEKEKEIVTHSYICYDDEQTNNVYMVIVWCLTSKERQFQVLFE